MSPAALPAQKELAGLALRTVLQLFSDFAADQTTVQILPGYLGSLPATSTPLLPETAEPAQATQAAPLAEPGLAE